METCPGCEKQYKSYRSLNSHKRFCTEWQKVKDQYQSIHSSLDEIKNIPTDCPHCGKSFKNIYSMSAHKGHCLGLTPKYSDLNVEAKNKMRWNKGKILNDIDMVFCKNSKYPTGYARKIILAQSLKVYSCEICSITEWNGKMITLELDHINGNNRDHRLNNLRFLCPNCHSQTDTWRGRNKNTGVKKISDDDLKEALSKTDNIRQALLLVGLAPKGRNYERCKKLIEQQKKK